MRRAIAFATGLGWFAELNRAVEYVLEVVALLTEGHAPAR
jgi:hypothetical protein